MVSIIDDNGHGGGQNDAFYRFNAAVEQALSLATARVAFDCEGVDLCRCGSLELVSLCFELSPSSFGLPGTSSEVFLIDLGSQCNSNLRGARVATLKKLFESQTVTKIIHDCKMDSDSLFHLFGITLVNVHDTSSFHTVITGIEDSNLNDVLQRNGVGTNLHRDKSVYKNNPTFWAMRPLTPMMVQWASSDVDKLLQVASKQLGALDGAKVERAKSHSTRNAAIVRDMQVERGLECKVHIGSFIGPRGNNLRSLQKRTGTFIYQQWSTGQYNKKWMVFYGDEAGLAAVKRAMGG